MSVLAVGSCECADQRTWSRRKGQATTSTSVGLLRSHILFSPPSVTKIYQVGIQLHQVGTNVKGKPLGSGGIVHDIEEAIKAEMAETWSIMRDEVQYSEFRRNNSKLHRTVEDSCSHGLAKAAKDSIVEKYLS